jgi:hypothetical protein
MKIQIEKGVPAPTRQTRTSKYPFRDMKVGDSFFIKSTEPESMRKKLSSASNMFCKLNAGFKFKTQVFDAGVRIWRVE